MVEEQPWDNETATRYIHQIAGAEAFALTKELHAEERMLERDILAGDLLHILKYGQVVRKAELSTRDGFFKYKIQSQTPNSEGRLIRAVVIPCLEKIHIAVITVMWLGEKNDKGGHDKAGE